MGFIFLLVVCVSILVIHVQGNSNSVLYLPSKNAAVSNCWSENSTVYTGDAPLCNYEANCMWSVLQFDLSDLPDFVRATIREVSLQLSVQSGVSQNGNLFQFNVKLDNSFNEGWLQSAASATYFSRTNIALTPTSSNMITIATFSFPTGINTLS